MTVFSFVTAMVSPHVVSIVNTNDNDGENPETFFTQLAVKCSLTVAAGTGQFMLQGGWDGLTMAYEILEKIETAAGGMSSGQSEATEGACPADEWVKQECCCPQKCCCPKKQVQIGHNYLDDMNGLGYQGLEGIKKADYYDQLRPYSPELKTEVETGKNKGNSVMKPTHVAQIPAQNSEDGTPLKILVYQPKKISPEYDDELTETEEDEILPKKNRSDPSADTVLKKASTPIFRTRKAGNPQKRNQDDNDSDPDYDFEDSSFDQDAADAGNSDPSSDEEDEHDEVKVEHEQNKHHSDIEALMEEIDSVSPEGSNMKLHQCKGCEYKSKERAMLREHILRIHVGDKSKQCPICGKCYSVNKDLKRHIVRHSVRHTCGVCGKQYKAQRSLREHMNSHDDGYVKPYFPCDECDRTFSAKHTLQAHVESVHRGIKKSFLCTICGKNFTQKQTLSDHQMIHTGQRPFHCEICGSDFNNKQTLKRHKRLHTEVIRFQCELCGKEFRSKAGLRMHTAIHLGTTPHYDCSICNKVFTQKQALIRHSRIHSGEKPFKCDLCTDAFSDLSILRRHVMGVHKQEFKTKRPRIQPSPTIYKTSGDDLPTSSNDQINANSEDNIVPIRESPVISPTNVPVMSSYPRHPENTVSAAPFPPETSYPNNSNSMNAAIVAAGLPNIMTWTAMANQLHNMHNM